MIATLSQSKPPFVKSLDYSLLWIKMLSLVLLCVPIIEPVDWVRSSNVEAVSRTSERAKKYRPKKN